MTPIKQRAEEAKLNIDGQWFVRGNRSSMWLALNSRPDGSTGGIAEKIPREAWPILERVVELERALAVQQVEHEAELARWSAVAVQMDRVSITRIDELKAERDAAVAEALKRAAQMCFTVAAKHTNLSDGAFCYGEEDEISAAISALAPRTDLVCVPMEPTEAMLRAALDAKMQKFIRNRRVKYKSPDGYETWMRIALKEDGPALTDAYKAMLAAAETNKEKP